jgi:hypothetical protein
MTLIIIIFIVLIFAFYAYLKEDKKPKINNAFCVGDKVTFSDKVLEEFGAKSNFYSKHVFQVTDIYESESFDIFGKGITTRGIKVLRLNCGTVLYDFQAKKLPKDTQLFH